MNRPSASDTDEHKKGLRLNEGPFYPCDLFTELLLLLRF
jgi:hypothetical protein